MVFIFGCLVVGGMRREVLRHLCIDVNLRSFNQIDQPYHEPAAVGG